MSCWPFDGVAAGLTQIDIDEQGRDESDRASGQGQYDQIDDAFHQYRVSELLVADLDACGSHLLGKIQQAMKLTVYQQGQRHNRGQEEHDAADRAGKLVTGPTRAAARDGNRALFGGGRRLAGILCRHRLLHANFDRMAPVAAPAKMAHVRFFRRMWIYFGRSERVREDVDVSAARADGFPSDVFDLVLRRPITDRATNDVHCGHRAGNGIRWPRSDIGRSLRVHQFPAPFGRRMDGRTCQFASGHGETPGRFRD